MNKNKFVAVLFPRWDVCSFVGVCIGPVLTESTSFGFILLLVFISEKISSRQSSSKCFFKGFSFEYTTLMFFHQFSLFTWSCYLDPVFFLKFFLLFDFLSSKSKDVCYKCTLKNGSYIDWIDLLFVFIEKTLCLLIEISLITSINYNVCFNVVFFFLLSQFLGIFLKNHFSPVSLFFFPHWINYIKIVMSNQLEYIKSERKSWHIFDIITLRVLFQYLK